MKFFRPHRPERVLLRRNTLYVASTVHSLSKNRKDAVRIVGRKERGGTPIPEHKHCTCDHH